MYKAGTASHVFYVYIRPYVANTYLMLIDEDVQYAEFRNIVSLHIQYIHSHPFLTYTYVPYLFFTNISNTISSY